jgi:hypothetical protein
MIVRLSLALLLSLTLGYAQEPTPADTPATDATPVPESISIPDITGTPEAAPSTEESATPSAPSTPAVQVAGDGKETALPAIKASVNLPAGWYIREQTEDGVTVYQISREKVESESDTFTAGLILSVTTKVPERAEMKPSAYAAELLSATQDDPMQPLKKSVAEGLQILRNDYQIEDESAGQQMVSVATSNDASGTLYFVTWQSPIKEEAKLAPIRESILSSFKFDPAY